MFQLEKLPFGKFTKLILRNNETGEYLAVIPEHGANVNELVLRKNGTLYPLLKGDKDYDELMENRWFRGAKLMPFPNRIKEGKYKLEGKKFQLNINLKNEGHAIHGLVYDKKFEVAVIDLSEKDATITLEYESKGVKGYPFRFRVSITYKLDAKGFSCTTEVRNDDTTDIPLGDGWHPYFSLNNKVDDLYLKMPASKKILVDKRSIPTGKHADFSTYSSFHKIGKQVLDTCFAIKEKKRKAVTEIKDDDVTLQLWQETGKDKYNYLQIFTPPSRKTIAIEPMTCNVDAFNNKEGLIMLKPGKRFFASYGVSLI